MFKAVIFDCDGVLVDSEPETFRMLAEDLAEAGLALTPAELEPLFLGGTIPGVFREARQLGAALPENWVKTFYDRLYARLARGVPLIEGIPQVLDALDAAGVPYAVGSNGTTEKMLTTLGQHPGVMRRLKGRLFSGQELNMPKPDPGLYRHVAQFLGVDAVDCAVIEDSPTGARAARLAGMRCFAYAPEGGAKLEAEGARVFRRMEDLPALLLQ